MISASLPLLVEWCAPTHSEEAAHDVSHRHDLQPKGGSGKTTTCMTLAAGIAGRGYDVLVVDADPQGTATRWGSSAPESAPFPATVINLAAAKANVHRMVKDHVEKFDVILLDCPPAVESPATQSALLISDLAVVPVIPRPGELWALERLFQLLAEARAAGA